MPGQSDGTAQVRSCETLWFHKRGHCSPHSTQVRLSRYATGMTWLIPDSSQVCFRTIMCCLKIFVIQYCITQWQCADVEHGVQHAVCALRAVCRFRCDLCVSHERWMLHVRPDMPLDRYSTLIDVAVLNVGISNGCGRGPTPIVGLADFGCALAIHIELQVCRLNESTPFPLPCAWLTRTMGLQH